MPDYQVENGSGSMASQMVVLAPRQAVEALAVAKRPQTIWASAPTTPYLVDYHTSGNYNLLRWKNWRTVRTPGWG
jgi:hypothetical protein